MKNTHVCFLCLFAVSIGGCNPAGTLLEEADQLAANGSYDEALVKYEEIREKYPDKDESVLAWQGINNSMALKSGALFTSGDYEASGRTFVALVDRVGELDKTNDLVWEATQTNAVLAADYVVIKDDGLTDDVLDEMAGWIQEQSELMPDGLRAEASGWLCGNRTSFPAYSTCKNVDADLGNVAPQDASAQREAVDESCRYLAKLQDVCEAEIKEEITAIVESDNLTAYRTAVEQKVANWERDSERESNDIGRKATRLADECERAIKNAVQIEEKWFVPVMSGNRAASFQFASEQKPHNLKIGENQELLDELAEGVADNNWPGNLVETTEKAVREERRRCER